ncbi:hypothetical protein SUGI_1138920 [Cryptomeria japonica]|nr:hypothetical protein SUGI_1138920 [Cryptomeria japonica]
MIILSAWTEPAEAITGGSGSGSILSALDSCALTLHSPIQCIQLPTKQYDTETSKSNGMGAFRKGSERWVMADSDYYDKLTMFPCDSPSISVLLLQGALCGETLISKCTAFVRLGMSVYLQTYRSENRAGMRVLESSCSNGGPYHYQHFINLQELFGHEECVPQTHQFNGVFKRVRCRLRPQSLE